MHLGKETYQLSAKRPPSTHTTELRSNDLRMQFHTQLGTNSSKKKGITYTFLICNSNILCDLLMKSSSCCLACVLSACHSLTKKILLFIINLKKI